MLATPTHRDSASAVSQPGHRFPEPSGSRRTLEDTKEKRFEFKPALEDTDGYPRTDRDAGSGP